MIFWNSGEEDSGGLGVEGVLLQGDDAFSWRGVPLPHGVVFAGCSKDALLSVELTYLKCRVMR